MAVLGSLFVRRAIGIGALVALTVLGLSSPGSAQDEGAALEVSFESVSLPDSIEPSQQLKQLMTAGGDNRYVAFNADVLMDDLQAAESVNLELFDGVEFSLSVVNSSDGVVGSRFWSASNGAVEATFTELNGRIEARIADTENSALYRIIGVDGAVHFVVEDSVEYEQELEVQTPGVFNFGGPDHADDQVEDAPAGDITANAGPQVDVLAWYDDSAVTFWGSAVAAEAAIAAAYNNGNDAADRSGALVTLNVVELEQVSWTPPVSAVDAVFAIRSQTDGILDEVHAARDAAAADLVAVIGDLTGGCGIAFVPQTTPVRDRPDLGFSYTDAACVGGNLTLVHETAHNFGASHDIGASQPGPGLFSYSQGYVNPASGYRTIMSYTTACGGCLRVPYFSNPNALYNGNPTGDPGKDNARTLTETAAEIAAYRTGGDTTDPDTAILAPAQNATVSDEPAVLSGTAEDNVGVTRVRLTIYQTGSFNTWNGSSFTSAFSTVDATLDPPGAALTGWSYNLTGAPDGQVVFTAVAYDAAGNSDSSQPWRLFDLANDSTPPDAQIDSPSPGETVSSPVELAGEATDNSEVSRVRLTIYETDGYNTWDGESFTAPFSTVDASVTPTDGGYDWSYNLAGAPDGQVVFTALAYDPSGNTDPTKPWRLFNIDNNADSIAPDGVINNPTQGEAVASQPVVLDGSASDNVGVTRVRLTIYNTANNHTWNGSSFTSTYTAVEAAVNQNGTNATWSYDMTNPGNATQVVFTALAYDAAGNTDTSRPWRLFEILAS